VTPTATGATVSCTDGTEATVTDGENGTSCDATYNADGTVAIRCGDAEPVVLGRPPAPDTPVLELVAGVVSVGNNDGVGIEARMDGALHAAFTPDGQQMIFVDTFNRTIRRYGLRTRRVETLAGTAGVVGADDGVGPAASFEGPRGIAIHPDGRRVFIADGFNCTIREMDLVTREVTTLTGAPRECGDIDGPLSDARLRLTIGMVMHPNGRHLYFADRGNNRIRRIDLTAGVVEPVAGDLSLAFNPRRGHLDGVGAVARFSGPGGVDLSADGTVLYVNDTFNSVLRSIDLAAVDGDGNPTFPTVTIAGAPGVSGNTDGVGGDARFSVSQGLTRAGNLLLVGGFHNTIRALDLNTFTVTTLSGIAGVSGGTDGPGPNARFDVAFGIHAHPDGRRVFYMDRGNNNIRLLDLATGLTTTVMGPENPSDWVDGPLLLSRFRSPGGIALRADGSEAFVADSFNHVIRRIDVQLGRVETLAGIPQASGFADGFADTARFNTPTGVQLSADERQLWIADRTNRALRTLDLETLEVTTLLGGPFSPAAAATESPIDGPAALVRMGQIHDLAVDEANGVVYFGDVTLQRIRRLSLSTGAVSTLAGGSTRPVQDGIDGVGEDARFNSPQALLLAGDSLWVSDTSHHVVRRVNITTGEVVTVAGDVATAGSFDGVGDEAAFRSPRGLAWNGGDTLWIADGSNFAVRALDIPTGEVTTVAGLLGVSGGEGRFPRVPLADSRFYFMQRLAWNNGQLWVVADQGIYRIWNLQE
jgi:sugar lactone lactonase YvrE